MLARVRSAAVLGIDAYLVEVETDIANGLPTFVTVGLPQGAVKEGRDRVSSALANTGFTFPLKRITVNLAPADIRKEGSAFDLPIALGILAATEQVAGVGGGRRLDRRLRPGGRSVERRQRDNETGKQGREHRHPIEPPPADILHYSKMVPPTRGGYHPRIRKTEPPRRVVAPCGGRRFGGDERLSDRS